jgi:hypothetical protein
LWLNASIFRLFFVFLPFNKKKGLKFGFYDRNTDRFSLILNNKVKLPNENDAIGIIICKEKNRTVVEYSLKTSNMPIGVATYTTTAKLPDNYQNFLPDSETIIKNLESYFRV